MKHDYSQTVNLISADLEIKSVSAILKMINYIMQIFLNKKSRFYVEL